MRNNNNPQVNTKQHRLEVSFLVVLTFILFAAYAFRLWNLGTQSLWHDEAWSVFQSYTPFNRLDPNYPPAYTIFLGGWIRVVGDEVWTMRYFTLLWSVITIAAGALLARRWFGNVTGILTAILLAASPTLWVFSQEIRSYVMMPLFTIILLALAERVTCPQQAISRPIWIRILLIEIIALYTHNLGVPLTAWLNVTVIAAFALQRQWRRILLWSATQIGLFLVYLPWLRTQRPTGTVLNTPPDLGLSLLWDIWQSYFTGIKQLLNADSLLVILTAVFGVLAVVGIVGALSLRPSRRTWFTLSQVVLLPTFELIIILAAHIDFHPRYFILGIPSTLMLTAAGWSGLAQFRKPSPEQLPENKKRFWVYRYPLLQSALIVIALLLTVRMVTVIYSNAGYQHDDFRAVAEYYAKLNADAAIVIPYGWEPTLAYYMHKMNFKARIVGIPLHSSEDMIMSLLREDGDLAGTNHVELFTWYQLPADVRGAYPCWISTMYDPVNSQTFSGINTVIYVRSTGEGFGTTEPVKSIEFISPSAKIRLQDAWAVTRFNRTCLITWWALAEPTRENLSLAVHVLNPLEWEITKKDSALLNDTQHPTSLWQPGNTESVFSLIELPDNTVGSEFPVTLTVYSAEQPSGLDVVIDNQIKGKAGIVTRITSRPNLNATVQPTEQDTAVGNGLYLHGKTVPDSATQFKPGDEIRMSLEWWRTDLAVDDSVQDITVTLTNENNSWSVQSTEKLYISPKALTWHSLRIPAQVGGKAVLLVKTSSDQSIQLAEYNVSAIERTFVEPSITHRVQDSTFSGVGALVGVDVPNHINYGDQVRVQLTWKANATPEIAYTVFVHLLDSGGQVIAQSDAQPIDRPTTGWLEGEYIVDIHMLNWNREYHGGATLEVGLYDASTGNRVLLENGGDHVVLPLKIDVK